MTTISSLNAGLITSLTPSTNPTNSLASTASSAADAYLASTIVTIPSTINASPLVYTPDGALEGVGSTVTWANANTDSISRLMANDYTSTSMSGQFSNLGSALLENLGKTGNNYSQSVTATSASGTAGTALGMQGAQGEIKLTIQTASGATVDVDLESEDGTLSVSLNSSGTLSDSERTAIAGLANGFQQAIDGLTTSSFDVAGLGGSSPTLDLSGLMQYDPSVLSSVSLQVNVTGDGLNNVSANVALNDKTKSVSLTDSAGSINLSVNASGDSDILGTSAQQSQTIANYLTQFDNANAEGHGNSGLMSLFKEAFTQLNSNDGSSSSTQQAVGIDSPAWLAQASQAMLTGLPDFTASITDNSVSSNPLLPDQTDSFSYQVSQSTQIETKDNSSTITQTQQSLLKATYHTSLSGGPAKLTPNTSSQNYDYVSINDSASSSVNLAVQGGKLLDATLSQTSSESIEVQEYLQAKLVSDVTTPSDSSDSKDLLSLLKPFIADGDASENAGDWQQELSNLHSLIQLNPAVQAQQVE